MPLHRFFPYFFPFQVSVDYQTPKRDPADREELQEAERAEEQEAREANARRQAEKYERLARFSLDPENRRKYAARAEEWRQSAAGQPFADRAAQIMQRAKAQYGGGLVAKEVKKDFSPLPESGVVAKLRKEAKSWIAKLSQQEKRSIRKYTYNSGDESPNRFFERLNAMLRGDRPYETGLANHAELISNAIKKNTLKHDIIAYRGVDINPAEGIPVGRVFRSLQFVSSSVVESRAFGKKFMLIINVPKGSRAAYIEGLSKFPKQRELLLDKGCLFRVKSKHDNVIEIEVIA